MPDTVQEPPAQNPEDMQPVQFGQFGQVYFPKDWTPAQIEQNLADNTDHYRSQFVSSAMESVTHEPYDYQGGVYEGKVINRVAGGLATGIAAPLVAIGKEAMNAVKPIDIGPKPTSENERYAAWREAGKAIDYYDSTKNPNYAGSFKTFEKDPADVQAAWAKMHGASQAKIDEWRMWRDQQLSRSPAQKVLEAGRAANKLSEQMPGNETIAKFGGMAAEMVPVIATSMIPGLSTGVMAGQAKEETSNETKGIYLKWGIPEGQAETMSDHDGDAAAAFVAGTVGATHKIYGAAKAVLGIEGGASKGATIAENLLKRTMSDQELVTLSRTAKNVAAAAVQNGGDMFSNALMQGAWAMKRSQPDLTWNEALRQATSAAFEGGAVGVVAELIASGVKFRDQAGLRALNSLVDSAQKERAAKAAEVNPPLVERAKASNAPLTAEVIKSEIAPESSKDGPKPLLEGTFIAPPEEVPFAPPSDAPAAAPVEMPPGTPVEALAAPEATPAPAAGVAAPAPMGQQDLFAPEPKAPPVKAPAPVAPEPKAEAADPAVKAEEAISARQAGIEDHLTKMGYEPTIARKFATGEITADDAASQITGKDSRDVETWKTRNYLESVAGYQSFLQANGKAAAKAFSDKAFTELMDRNPEEVPISKVPVTDLRTHDQIDIGKNKFTVEKLDDGGAVLHPMTSPDGFMNPYGIRRFGPDSTITVDGKVVRDASGNLTEFVPKSNPQGELDLGPNTKKLEGGDIIRPKTAFGKSGLETITAEREFDQPDVQDQLNRVSRLLESVDPKLRKFVEHLTTAPDADGRDNAPMGVVHGEGIPRGTVYVDPKLAKRMSDALIRKGLEEEAIHHADAAAFRAIHEAMVKGGKYSGTFLEFNHFIHEKIYSEMTPRQRQWVRDAYGATSPRSSAAEFLRMLVQRRATGSLTERQFRADFTRVPENATWIRRALSSIRDWWMHHLSMWKSSPSIRDHVARIEELLNGKQGRDAVLRKISDRVHSDILAGESFPWMGDKTKIAQVKDSQIVNDFTKPLPPDENAPTQNDLIPMTAGLSKSTPPPKPEAQRKSNEPTPSERAAALPIPKPEFSNKGAPIEVRVAGGSFVYQHEPGRADVAVSDTLPDGTDSSSKGLRAPALPAGAEVPTPKSLEDLGVPEVHERGALLEPYRHWDLDVPGDILGHALELSDIRMEQNPRNAWMGSGDRESGKTFIFSRLLNRVAAFIKAHPENVVPGKIEYMGEVRDGMRLEGFSFSSIVEQLNADYIRRLQGKDRAHIDVSMESTVHDGPEGDTLRLADILSDIIPSYSDVDERFDGREVVQIFNSVLTQLPERTRTLLQGQMYGEYGWQEKLAKQYGMTPARISQLVDLSRRQFARGVAVNPEARAYVLGFVPEGFIPDPHMFKMSEREMLSAVDDVGAESPYAMARDLPTKRELDARWQNFGKEVAAEVANMKPEEFLGPPLPPAKPGEQIDLFGNIVGAKKLPTLAQMLPHEKKARDIGNLRKVLRMFGPGDWGAVGYIREVARTVPGTRAEAVLNELANRILLNVDGQRKLEGRWLAPMYSVLNRITDPSEYKLAKDDYERFTSAAQAGQHGAALRHSFDHAMKTLYPTLGKNARDLIDAWQQVSVEMGAEKTRLGVHVMRFGGPNGHEWVPFTDLGEMYHPKVLLREHDDTLSDIDGSTHFRAIENDLMMHNPTKFPHRQSVQQYFENEGNVLGLHSRGEFYAGVDIARGDLFPPQYYDYSLETALKTIPAQAKRIAEINAFGQDRGGKVDTIWKRALVEGTYQRRTSEHGIETGGLTETLNHIREAVLEIPNHQWGDWAIKLGSKVAALRFLTSFMTGLRNVAGSNMQIAEQFGFTAAFRSNAIGFADAMRALKDSYKGKRWIEPRMVEYAAAVGALQRGLYASTIHDLDLRNPGKIEKIAQKLHQPNSLLEMWNRGINVAASTIWLQQARRSFQTDPTGRAYRKAAATMQRWGFNAADRNILMTHANGEVFNRFLRQAVEEKQYSYKAHQKPIMFSSPIMRLLLQFQSWGAQRQRDIARNVLRPLFVGEVVDGQRIRDPLPMLRMVIGTLATASAVAGVKQYLFGREDRRAEWAEIMRTMDDDQLHAFSMGLSKFIYDMTATGQTGLIPDHLRAVFDSLGRGRDKSTLSPPAISSFNDAKDLVEVTFERGMPPDPMAFLRDFRDIMIYRQPLLKEAVDAARHTVLSGADTGTLYANQQTVGKIRSLIRRYNEETGAEGTQYRRSGSGEKGPNSQLFDNVTEALLIGDAAMAGDIINKATGDRTDKKLLANISRAITMRQPIAGQHQMNAKEYADFLDWVDRRVPGMRERIESIEEGYVEAARSAGVYSKRR
jgi:hypothetical protein